MTMWESGDRRALLTRAAVVAAASAGSAARSALAKRRPARDVPARRLNRANIVMVVLDDMRTTDWRAMRRTQAALKGATTYPNFVIGSPLCSPSRASLLTGMYTHNHGVLWNVSDPADSGGYSAYKRGGLDRKSIPYALQRAGYRTGMVGKFMNGFEVGSKQPAGWDRFVATWKYRYTDYSLIVDGQEIPSRRDDYVTDVLGEYAREFIETTPEEQPLFLYLAPFAPHSASITGLPQPAPRHASLFPGAVVEKDASFNEPDVSDKPTPVRDSPLLTQEEIWTVNAWERARLRTLASADEMIASVIETLRSAGKLANTSVLVMSDNGYGMGQHRLALGKATPYDSACRVPMIAWGKPFTKSVDDRLASNIDIAPTIARIAGIELPEADGLVLFESERRDFVHIDLRPQNAFSFSGHGLRSRDLLYYEYATGEREYYDMRVDPLELNNLWPPGSPAPSTPPGLYSPFQLTTRLAQMDGCKGSQCR